MKTVQEKGYTILELMIVLAVSASMFVIVATTFGGRQQQVQFTQGVRDFDSRLKDIINDVSLGYYPANESVTCTVSGNNSEPRVLDNPGIADPLGSNIDCISIGKVLQFTPSVTSEFNADDDQIIKIYNVVGLRRDANNNNPTTIKDAAPRGVPGPEESLLKWGLRIKSAVYTNSQTGAQTESSGVAIFSKLNRGSQLVANASNEAVQISAIPGVDPGLEEAGMIREIDDIQYKIGNGSMSLSNASEITVCVTDADDNRKATITFGGSISGSVIDFDNFNPADCA
jgi:prepilin-type N-terminal cleavage/methylation domain-containing protein